MIKKISHTILKIKKCIGIDITVLPDDSYMISAVLLSLQKNNIRKEKELRSCSSLEDLRTELRSSWNGAQAQPVALSINGKGVLQKPVPPEALTGNPGNLVNAVLPNANPNDFYCTVLPNDVVCLIRQDTFEKLTRQFLQLGFQLLSVNLGTSSLQYALPFLNHDPAEPLLIPQLSVPVTSWDKSRKIEYNIGDQYVYAETLLAFGAAMGLLADDLTTPPLIPDPPIAQQRTLFKDRRYFHATAYAALIGLFLLLFVNFLVYEHYFTKNSQWQSSQIISREQEEKIKKREQQSLRKEHFLAQGGWETPSRISFAADRIASLVPSGTQLTILHLKRDTIQLSGNCDDPTELNQFVNNCRNIEAFKEVDIRNYKKKKDNDPGTFLMEIITK